MSKEKQTFFESVYHTNKDKIYRLCLGFTGNVVDAEDLLQEVLLKVWNHLDRFQGKSKVETWIYRVATNTALLYVNRKKRSRTKFRETPPEQLNFKRADHDSTIDLQINQLYQAISKLKDMDRIIISLVLEDKSYKAIAEITGLQVNHIGVKINRIKKELKKILENG
ncbi:MAG: sigma-70 family RNA polymerase sigma factor [Bacteroidota bacterium]